MGVIYTRTGDSGTTGLFGGTRVSKLDPLVEAYGTLDETNAAIGQAKAATGDASMRADLQHIQQRLFVAAAELASDEAGRAIVANTISAADVADLEQLIDRAMAETGPQKNFVVPGRDRPSAALHHARTVARRGERRLLEAAINHPLRPELSTYLNRLSDALYALARLAEHRHDLSRIEELVRSLVTKYLGAAQTSGGGAEKLRWSPASGFHSGAQKPNDADVPGGAHHVVSFDLETIKVMTQAAEDEGARMGVPIVFAAVDEGGNLLLVHRMADSLLGSLDLACNKAFTSAAFRQPTADLAEQSVPGAALHGIQNSNRGRVVVFGGGLPVFHGGASRGGTLCGGIGVSGGTVEQDMVIVAKALSVAKELCGARKPELNQKVSRS